MALKSISPNVTRLAGSRSVRRRGRRRGGSRRLGWRKAGVKPTGMDPAVQRFLGLGIDVSLPDQAAESGLDMGARAAETIVKIEMAEGGVEVVPPQQADHAAAEPDAFRVAGGAGQQPGRFGDLIDLLLAFLGSIGGRLLRLRRLAVAALGERRGGHETEGCHAEHGTELTQLKR